MKDKKSHNFETAKQKTKDDCIFIQELAFVECLIGIVLSFLTVSPLYMIKNLNNFHCLRNIREFRPFRSLILFFVFFYFVQPFFKFCSQMEEKIPGINTLLFKKTGRIKEITNEGDTGASVTKVSDHHCSNLSVFGTGCLRNTTSNYNFNEHEHTSPLISGCKNEKDLSLNQLTANLNIIREEGFGKLSRLVRDLHIEKHAYKENIDDIGHIIDERVSKMKSDIDQVHLEMREKLKQLKSEASRRMTSEIDTCRKNVREMNELVQTSLQALDTKTADYMLLFQLNLQILEKLNYMKSLKTSQRLPLPIFQGNTITKEDISRLLGSLNEGKPKTHKTYHASSRVENSLQNYPYNSDVENIKTLERQLVPLPRKRHRFHQYSRLLSQESNEGVN